MRDAGKTKAHLDAAKRPDEHEVVEAAEMADAEHTARELRQADAERHVEVLEDDAAQSVGVVALRHEHRGHRVRVLPGILADDLEAPGPNGRARRLAVPRVTREDVREPL